MAKYTFDPKFIQIEEPAGGRRRREQRRYKTIAYTATIFVPLIVVVSGFNMVEQYARGISPSDDFVWVMQSAVYFGSLALTWLFFRMIGRLR